MSRTSSHDDYIAAATESLRPVLTQLRDQLRQELPEAQEFIAYDLPGFRLGGATVAAYAAFTRQCGLYVDPAAIASLSAELVAAGFRPTKTGVKFSPGKPLPQELVRELVRASRESLGR